MLRNSLPSTAHLYIHVKGRELLRLVVEVCVGKVGEYGDKRESDTEKDRDVGKELDSSSDLIVFTGDQSLGMLMPILCVEIGIAETDQHEAGIYCKVLKHAEARLRSCFRKDHNAVIDLD